MTTIKDTIEWLHTANPLAAPGVENQARRLLLDTVGCMIAGLAKPEPAGLARSLAALDEGAVRLPGSDAHLTTLSAAYISGIAACWDEACEGLARAHGRPGLHAFAAALPLALAGRRTLGETLVALTMGYELAGRMGERLRIRPGMHVDGTWGTFGAVAAAAKIFELSETGMLAAVEGAATHLPFSLYLPVAQGATVRNAYVGEAAMRGIASALAVQAGMTTPEGGADDYQELALGGGDERFKAPPGEWLIKQGYLKPFAAVRHVHYGAQAALDWRQANPDTQISGIKTLKLSVYEEAMTYCGNRQPKTAIQAQFSLSYGLASALAQGDLGPEAYTAAAMTAPTTLRLEEMLEITPDKAATDAGLRRATLTVETATDASVHSVHSVAGDQDQLLTDVEVSAKFKRYAGPVIGSKRATSMAEQLLTGSLNAVLADQLAA